MRLIDYNEADVQGLEQIIELRFLSYANVPYYEVGYVVKETPKTYVVSSEPDGSYKRIVKKSEIGVRHHRAVWILAGDGQKAHNIHHNAEITRINGEMKRLQEELETHKMRLGEQINA